MIVNKHTCNTNSNALLGSVFIISLFIFCPAITFSQDSNYINTVVQFIDIVKQNNIEKITERTNYPLKRQKPLTDIGSKKDFQNRYHEVFDDSLMKLIINSDVKNDWSEMGWRGIMFLNGKLWLDEEGNLTSVNYESQIENKKRDSLVAIDKLSLYPGLRNFKAPVLCWETKKFRIRIDDLGNSRFRYASWPVNKDQSAKPDLVLMNGKVKFDGSGGNHEFIFENNGYTYVCNIMVIVADDSEPYTLTVLKNGQEIFSEAAVRIVFME